MLKYVDTKTVDGYPSARKNYVNKESRWRRFYITALKNHPMHQYTQEFIDILTDENEDEHLRVLTAEALAWFNTSVNKEKIADACKGLLDKGGMSEELTREVKRAYSRLTSKK